ncbi:MULTISPECIES: 2-dehydro-3-deoxyphosphooctonate aldolase [Flavobacterium]|uniref:2-dehydro-3-deoxyphosphooctonate aldolase n=1 Tax=Flavobacterium TaxID=237 RepID=UPI002E7AFE17|nr:2-dehydro-3-deoxyphosphooctonate aldolase [Flavobacterium rakeshii]MEE1898192.1 2-dehydro-3-deoxyphosphooctonate aldolase [Flavobacterium rakeshii]
MKKIFLTIVLAAFAASCISTRNTIKNIDNTARMPNLSKERTFIITETAQNNKYGYDQDWPVNLGFLPVQTAEINVKRYFDALTGPEGQKITYTKQEACCPFPSERNSMGAGLLDVYEVTWDGLATPVKIYINLYEKGKIMAPAGFGIKELK